MRLFGAPSRRDLEVTTIILGNRVGFLEREVARLRKALNKHFTNWTAHPRSACEDEKKEKE